MKKLLKTNEQLSATIIRVFLGLIIFPHGAQKALGWFGGYGFTGTMDFFTGTMHLHWLIGFMVIAIEFVGSVSLIAGFATRFWALAMAVLFVNIILTSHLSTGFFMDWFGQNPEPGNEGFEFHLLIIGMSIALAFSGAGRYSADKAIAGT